MKSKRFITKLKKSTLRGRATRRTKSFGNVPTDSIFTDLAQIEDQKDISFLQQIGFDATANALNENKALGISHSFWSNGAVIVKHSDGTTTTIETAHSSAGKEIGTGRRLKKGTVLHVRK